MMHSTLVLKEEVVRNTTGCSNSTGLLREIERTDRLLRDSSSSAGTASSDDDLDEDTGDDVRDIGEDGGWW